MHNINECFRFLVSQRGLTHGTSPHTRHNWGVRHGQNWWPHVPLLGKTQDPDSTSQTRLKTQLKRQPGKFGVAVMHLVCYCYLLTGYTAHAVNGCQVLQSQFPLHWNAPFSHPEHSDLTIGTSQCSPQYKNISPIIHKRYWQYGSRLGP